MPRGAALAPPHPSRVRVHELHDVAIDDGAEGYAIAITESASARVARRDTEGRRDLELRDVVETALAEALMLAARAGRWRIVEQIASELQERRYARSGAARTGPTHAEGIEERHQRPHDRDRR